MEMLKEIKGDSFCNECVFRREKTPDMPLCTRYMQFIKRLNYCETGPLVPLSSLNQRLTDALGPDRPKGLSGYGRGWNDRGKLVRRNLK